MVLSLQGRKTKQDTLGMDLTLHEARTKFMSLKVARQRGKLPRDVREESAPRDSFTIKQMIDLNFESLRRIRKKKGADEVARFMTNVVNPYGSFDVDDFRAR